MFRSSLFNGDSLYDWSQKLLGTIASEIGTISKDGLLAQPADQLAVQVWERYEPHVPTLRIQDQICDEPTASPGSPTVSLTFRVPYDGDGKFFLLAPSQHPVIEQAIVPMPNELVVTYKDVRRAAVEERCNSHRTMLGRIAECLDRMHGDVKRYTAALPQFIRDRIQERLQQFGEHDAFINKLESLIPIKKRNDGREKYIIPVEQKAFTVRREAASPAAKSEPLIEMAAYEGILDVLSHMMLVVERSPKVFSAMQEEHLRTVLLVALNGVFNGRATGETFNGAGKTDILITENDKNVFIAECLEWNGQQHLQSKIDDQLFRYATWRDSKLALIVFNRNKDFSAVINKMREVLQAHPQCIKPMPYTHESGCRFEFRRADDTARHFILTALAFELPKAPTPNE